MTKGKKLVDKTKCDLCESESAIVLFSNHDRMLNIRESYNLLMCMNCGLIYIYPQPSDAIISKHYDKEKYTVFNEMNEIRHLRNIYTLLECLYHYIEFNIDIKTLRIINAFMFLPIRKMFRTIQVINNGNFLDVGCGNGYFLFIMKYLGMKPYGIEPGEFDNRLAKRNNLNIFNGKLFDARYEDNFFDVITLNHVLEHTNKPSEMLKELYRILKPKGYLIIAVPKSDSLAFNLFGKYWAQLDTPRHLYTFSKKNLVDYALKYDFKVEKIRYNSTPNYQLICSVIFLLEQVSGREFGKSIIHNIFLTLMLQPFCYLLDLIGRGDQFEIILSK